LSARNNVWALLARKSQHRVDTKSLFLSFFCSWKRWMEFLIYLVFYCKGQHSYSWKQKKRNGRARSVSLSFERNSASILICQCRCWLQSQNVCLGAISCANLKRIFFLFFLVPYSSFFSADFIRVTNLTHHSWSNLYEVLDKISRIDFQ